MKELGKVDYAAGAPETYRCVDCGSCAMKDQNKAGELDEHGKRMTDSGKTDQIGWLVPAVPTEDGACFK